MDDGSVDGKVRVVERKQNNLGIVDEK